MHTTTLRGTTARLQRTALVLALGAIIASGQVHAQKATGDIFGHAAANSAVSIENTETGLKREISADANGRFAFNQLPTGKYKVTTGSDTREVTVRIGTGSEVNFSLASQSLETIEVTGNAINPIDVSSVESATVFTAEQIGALPVVRDISSVALLAPGTVKGDTGFGNLASFGGASIAENGYYINGFDVTNIRNFTSFANLPFEAIAQQQVKTGGYSAEFGRSLGGVINIVTKRGSNEWKAGASLYWEPDSLREHAANVVDNENPDTYYRYTASDTESEISYNVYGSGPIIKDKLFFFALAEGQNFKTENYAADDIATKNRNRKNDKPHGIVKLDWNLTDSHILEFTGISNRDYFDTVEFNAAAPYSTTNASVRQAFVNRNGGETYIGKYTGYLTDNFTVSAQLGQLEFLNASRVGIAPGADCPRVLDGRAGGALIPLGCFTADTVQDPNAPPSRDRRRAGRLDFEWHLGNHNLKFGYDKEKFNSTNVGSTQSGGEYWRYFARPASGRVNGVDLPADATSYVRRWVRYTVSGAYDVENEAAYIEDSWQITDRLVLQAGVRSESFENLNAEGVSFAKADNQIAPRLGFSWDANGDGSVKIFGNAGRYFIPVASNTNIRAAAAEYFNTDYFTYTSIDPVTGAPVGLGPQLGPDVLTSDGSAPIPATVTAANLKPMYQDELILGVQRAFNDQWSGGIRGVLREVKNGMDDYCYAGPFQQWADDNGYTNFDSHTIPGCVILNPGRDAEFAIDLNGDGNLTNVIIPARYFGLPQYRRKYTALEFFWEKVWDGKWYLQGSYTLSHSFGNAEGYVNSTLEQDDAGLTQDFDFASFTDGTSGNLPNDRRHSFKIFGAYQLTEDWRIAANAIIQSGRPRSCYGFVPTSVPDFDPVNDVGGSGSYTSASTLYCVDDQGNSVLRPRGSRGTTPWTSQYDLSLAWTPKFGEGNLTLKMDVFNVFNFKRPLEFNEIGDRNRAEPERNPNFGLPATYQTPRSFRFTARYDFSL
ncbi:MAG TPA: TonB-dependent receptor [Tahibacter sp.]|nr:TonB-dependent receptor [Tahibacter sp.]